MEQHALVVFISSSLLVAHNLLELHMDGRLFPKRRKDHWGRRKEDREERRETSE
jgi:hypothetical protein